MAIAPATAANVNFDMGVESKTERAVCAYVFKHYGVVSIKLHVTGWPDRLFLIPNGAPIFIEFKTPRQKPRAIQTHIHNLIKSLGYIVEVHDNEQRAIERIRVATEMATTPIPRKS